MGGAASGPKPWRRWAKLRGPAFAAAILLLSGFAGTLLAPGTPTAASASPVHPTAHPSNTAALSSAHLGSVPDVTVPAGGPGLSFWGTNSTFTDLPGTSQACARTSTGGQHTASCYPQSQNPTILTLPNGHIGVGYAVFTNRSSTACTGSAVNTLTRIGFATSPDGGHHFTQFSSFGNDTCAYLQATEPAFALSATGTIFSAFVEENKSTAKVPLLPPSYTARTIDALGFTSSTDNGATWAPVVSLNSSGNISRPAVAAFGNTVYLVYENGSNGTTNYPAGSSSGNVHAPALEFLRSSDAGVHWTGPSPLPGENATMGNWSTGASVAVNASGLLAIAYATNRSCAFGCISLSAGRYADDVVVITSRTNGTTWSPIHRVHAAVGESHCWSGYNGLISCYTAPFEWTPQTSLAFSANGSNLYVAWAGSYPVAGPLANAASYIRSGVFAAAGTSAAIRWKASTVEANLNGYTGNEIYLPAVGVAPNGTVWITYTEENVTVCNQCSGLNGAYSQWAVSSPDGISWSEPSFVTVSVKATPSTASASWAGWTASVGFTGTGTPLLGFSLPRAERTTTQTAGSNTYYNYTYPTNLSIAYPYSGPTIPLNVTEGGLAPGASWSFGIDGRIFTQSVRSVIVPGIPVNTTILIDAQKVIPGFWTQIAFSLNVPNSVSFSRPSTVFFNFTELFGFQLLYATVSEPVLDISFYYNGSYYYDDEYRYCYTTGYCYGNHYWSPVFPWYFPAGTVLSLRPTATPLVGYWNGTGNGSYTGTGSFANVTMDAPINETAWAIAAGIYNETFNPSGLPPTSSFSFTLGDDNYSAPANGSTNVSGLVTGAYRLANIQANSTTPGWEYFGVSSVGSTVVVPAQPIVNLSFASVDVAAAAGTVSFVAVGFTNGTVWDLTFNGTTYASSTPWINVTAHPGTYPWSVGAAAIVASNDSVGYAPLPVGPRVSVTPGTPVDVAFQPAYRVEVMASVGGSVTFPGVHWLADGTTATYNATPGPIYSFAGWSGTGSGNYTGTNPSANVTADGPLLETAEFRPLPTDRFNVTFTGVGLAPGTLWSVFLNGVGYSSTQQNLTVSDLYSCSAGSAGNYALSIPYAYANGSDLVRYVPGHYTGRFCLNGAAPPDVVTFTPQYTVQVQATGGGTVSLTVGNNQSSSSLWAFPTDFVQIQAFPGPTDQFVNWTGAGSGAYSGPSAVTTLSASGPVRELAFFQAKPAKVTPLYSIHFLETTAFAPGTVWNVTLAGVGYSSSTPYLNLTGFAASTYPLVIGVVHAPDNLTRYTPETPPTTVGVQKNATVTLSYTRAYWVTISTPSGGNVSGTTGWVNAGGSVTLNASPELGYTFEGWTGTGPGSYTGTNATQGITVTGPVAEVATFVPTVPPTPAASSVWQNPGLWAGLLVAGLAVGVVLGMLLGRRSGAGSAGPASPPDGPPETPPEESRASAEVPPEASSSDPEYPPEEAA